MSQTTLRFKTEKATRKKVSFYVAERASIHENFGKQTSTSPSKTQAQNAGVETSGYGFNISCQDVNLTRTKGMKRRCDFPGDDISKGTSIVVEVYIP